VLRGHFWERRLRTFSIPGYKISFIASVASPFSVGLSLLPEWAVMGLTSDLPVRQWIYKYLQCLSCGIFVKVEGECSPTSVFGHTAWWHTVPAVWANSAALAREDSRADS
jgi:hypothetical protein